MINLNQLKNRDWETLIFLFILIFWVLIKWVFPKNYLALTKLRRYVSVKENFVIFTISSSLLIIFIYSLWLWLVCLFYQRLPSYGVPYFFGFCFVLFLSTLLMSICFFLNILVFFQLGKKEIVPLFHRVKLFYELRFSFALLLSCALMAYVAPSYPHFYNINLIMVGSLFLMKYLFFTKYFLEIARVSAAPFFLYLVFLEIMPTFLFLRFMLNREMLFWE